MIEEEERLDEEELLDLVGEVLQGWGVLMTRSQVERLVGYVITWDSRRRAEEWLREHSPTRPRLEVIG